MVAGVQTIDLVAENLRRDGPQVAAHEDKVNAARVLFSVIRAFEPMIGEARFAGTVYGLVRLLPPGVAQARDGRIFDSRIEIAADDLREAVGILRALTDDHLHLLAPRIVRLVVEVDVQHAELRTALPVAQAHPVAVRARIVFHEQLPAASGVSDSQ